MMRENGGGKQMLTTNWTAIEQMLARQATEQDDVVAAAHHQQQQQQVDDEANHYRIQMYKMVIPVFLVLSLLAILANALVIVALRSARVRQNATVTLLTSLTSSDIWSCIVMGLSLLYNSYLPIVLQTHVEPCLALSLEMLRTGGLLTAALHLLLIALHHCVGIIRPHFNKDHLRRAILGLCALAWVVPPGCLWLLALSQPNQGFWNCERSDFYHTKAFRWTVSALLGTIFCAITLCYAKLLCILRIQHGKWPQQKQQQQVEQQQQKQQLLQHRPSLFRRDTRRSTTDTTSCAEVPSLASRGAKRRRRQRRTLWTTLLICASFLLGWAPASLLFALTCADCHVFASPAHYRVLFALSCTQLAFLLAKSLLNPLIYSLRIPEVNTHIHKCMITKWTFFNNCRVSKNGQFQRRMTAISIGEDTKRRKLRTKRRSLLFAVSSNSSSPPAEEQNCWHQKSTKKWGKTAAEMVKRSRRNTRFGLLLLHDGTSNGALTASAVPAGDNAFGDEKCHWPPKEMPKGTTTADGDRMDNSRNNDGMENDAMGKKQPEQRQTTEIHVV